MIKYCINGATTMPQPLEEDIRIAGLSGFDAVEIWHEKALRFLETHSVADLKALLDEHELEAASICPLMLNTDSDTGGIKRQLEAISAASELASGIGCKTLLLCIVGSGTIKDAAKLGSEAAKRASEHGVSLAIEPLGGHPLVPGPREAVAIIRESGEDNLGFMMDTFHYYKSGVEPEELLDIPEATSKLLIVHINDAPGLDKSVLQDSDRVYPGLGVLPLKRALKVLKRLGYKGCLSVETFNRTYWAQDPEKTAGDSWKTLDKLIKEAII